MTFQPIGDKILIRALTPISDSVIALPQSYIINEGCGEVVRLGTYMISKSGQRHQNFPVQPGDKITFNSGQGQAMKVESDGEELLEIHIGQIKTKIDNKIHPIGGKVLIRPTKKEYAGLIQLTDYNNDVPQDGEVVSLGTGNLNDKGETIPFNVSVGDKVFFKNADITPIKVYDEKLIIVRDAEILGIYE